MWRSEHTENVLYVLLEKHPGQINIYKFYQINCKHIINTFQHLI